MHREPVMSVTESVSSFKGFYDFYPSCRQLTHKLARLFGTEGTRRYTISFKEATKRLRTAVENSQSDVENITRKKVVKFKIGKVSVMSQANLTFDPMEPTTWGEVGGTNGRWREHKNDHYDGLIAVGCVTNELIPNVINERNNVIHVDHQMYALSMAQALVHHYMLQEPDGRLRNKSIDIGEGERGDEGGIIYIAYKLEDIFLEMSSLAIKEEEPDGMTATIEFLKIKLEEDGLHFRGSIPDDENSFFKACSDQLQRPEISGHTHSELRQMVIPYLNLCSENEIKSAKFTSDTWKVYIDNVAKDKGNVEDIVVENMAKLLQKQIIVYSYKNEISRNKFNEEANGEPLLLAKDKLYYQSLERRHDITPSRLQESNTSMYSPELTRYDETVRMADLEEKLISSCANDDSCREGRIKASFNYLLLDPRITKNLPSRMDSLGEVESFKVFVEAIFYVGKGQSCRPFVHLHEANSQMEKTKTQVSEKVKYIQDIWSDNVGVVSLHCFQNAIAVEAYTREACMIDAISVHKLTNMRKGTYYGISERWSEKEKRDMGFYFLRRALKIFKEEGERPLLPGDLKGGQ